MGCGVCDVRVRVRVRGRGRGRGRVRVRWGGVTLPHHYTTS